MNLCVLQVRFAKIVREDVSDHKIERNANAFAVSAIGFAPGRRPSATGSFQ